MLGLVATVGLVDWFIHFDELPLALLRLRRARDPRPLAPRHGLRHASLRRAAPPPRGARIRRAGDPHVAHVARPGTCIGPRGPRRPEHPFFVVTLGSVATMLLTEHLFAAVNLTATTRGRSSVSPAGPAAAASSPSPSSGSFSPGSASLEDIAAFVRWDRVGQLASSSGPCTGLHARRPRPGPACLPTDAEAGMEPGLPLCGCDVVRVRWRHRRGRRPHGWRDRGGIARRAGDHPGGHRRRDPRLPRGGLRAFGLVAIGGLVHLADMFLLYTSARPVEYAVPGAPAAAAASH